MCCAWCLDGAEVSLRQFGTGAELSWVRNVQGPKCPYTADDLNVCLRKSTQCIRVPARRLCLT